MKILAGILGVIIVIAYTAFLFGSVYCIFFGTVFCTVLLIANILPFENRSLKVLKNGSRKDNIACSAILCLIMWFACFKYALPNLPEIIAIVATKTVNLYSFWLGAAFAALVFVGVLIACLHGANASQKDERD